MTSPLYRRRPPSKTRSAFQRPPRGLLKPGKGAHGLPKTPLGWKAFEGPLHLYPRGRRGGIREWRAGLYNCFVLLLYYFFQLAPPGHFNSWTAALL